MRRLLVLLAVLAAALGQAQVRETYNIVYTSASGFPQRLDLFQPALSPFTLPVFSSHRRPGIVMVHGGGWSGGDKSAYTALGRYYAALGYVCVSINYRLAPLHVWPAQIDDTQAAVRWMRKNSRALGVDPSRIGAVGASAGGHLVLFLGETDTFNDFDPLLSGYSSRVQAVVDYFGPTDMTNPIEWASNIWLLIQNLVGQTWLPGSAAYRAVSPLYYVTPDDAPTVVFHGTADNVVPVAQSQRIVAAMQSSLVPVAYYQFPGEGHGFTGGVSNFTVNVMTAFFAQELGP
jgi:acetyl esterase/lipase